MLFRSQLYSVTHSTGTLTSYAAHRAEGADVILDTSRFTVHQLRDYVRERYDARGEGRRMVVSVLSFGYKHGVPVDADLVIPVSLSHQCDQPISSQRTGRPSRTDFQAARPITSGARPS